MPHPAKPLPVTDDPDAGGTRVDVVLYGDVAMSLAAPDLRALRAHRPRPRPLPSFVAGSWLAVATVHGHVVGCGRVAPAGSAGLELTELVVEPLARGCGIGSLLTDTLAALATDGRVRVRLEGAERAGAPFFRGRGWGAAEPGEPVAPGTLVLLGPGHPVRAGGGRTEASTWRPAQPPTGPPRPGNA